MLHYYIESTELSTQTPLKQPSEHTFPQRAGQIGLQSFGAACARKASVFKITPSVSSPAKLDLKTRKKI